MKAQDAIQNIVPLGPVEFLCVALMVVVLVGVCLLVLRRGSAVTGRKE